MNMFRQRVSQKLVLATAAIILSSFPMHKPLAEEPPKKPAMSEQLNLGALKVDLSKCDTSGPVPSCKQGRRILVSVTDAEGKTVTDAKIKVNKPDGSSFMVVNNGIQNFVLMDSPGEYAFEYQNKTFVIFVERSSSPVVNELGILKLNVDSHRLNGTVFVNVVNDTGEQIKGEKVKVISPTGELSEIVINNEQNSFTFSEIGRYNFEYMAQSEMVCIAPWEDVRLKISDTFCSKDLETLSSSARYFDHEYPSFNQHKIQIGKYEVMLRISGKELNMRIVDTSISENAGHWDANYKWVSEKYSGMRTLSVPLDEFFHIAKVIRGDGQDINSASIEYIEVFGEHYESSCIIIVLKAGDITLNDVIMAAKIDIDNSTFSARYLLNSDLKCFE